MGFVLNERTSGWVNIESSQLITQLFHCSVTVQIQRWVEWPSHYALCIVTLTLCRRVRVTSTIWLEMEIACSPSYLCSKPFRRTRTMMRSVAHACLKTTSLWTIIWQLSWTRFKPHWEQAWSCFCFPVILCFPLFAMSSSAFCSPKMLFKENRCRSAPRQTSSRNRKSFTKLAHSLTDSLFSCCTNFIANRSSVVCLDGNAAQLIFFTVSECVPPQLPSSSETACHLSSASTVPARCVLDCLELRCGCPTRPQVRCVRWPLLV